MSSTLLSWKVNTLTPMLIFFILFCFFLEGLDDGAPLESNGNGDSNSVARARDGSGGLF